MACIDLIHYVIFLISFMPDLFPFSSHNTICVAPKLDPWDHDFFASCPDPPSYFFRISQALSLLAL